MTSGAIGAWRYGLPTRSVRIVRKYRLRTKRSRLSKHRRGIQHGDDRSEPNTAGTHVRATHPQGHGASKPAQALGENTEEPVTIHPSRMVFDTTLDRYLEGCSHFLPASRLQKYQAKWEPGCPSSPAAQSEVPNNVGLLSERSGGRRIRVRTPCVFERFPGWSGRLPPSPDPAQGDNPVRKCRKDRPRICSSLCRNR